MVRCSAPPLLTDCEELYDPVRLAALAQAGLTARPDPAMELAAERVRRRLQVPVALVSLVQPDRQVFPGMAGLTGPFAERRSTPLTHSFCQHVVITAAPLVVEDARTNPLVAANLAVADLGVVAYAGMPLTDADGNVLGSLCAIDTVPRAWTASHLEVLGDLAAACSTELRLRLARFDAEAERVRRDGLEQVLRRQWESSQALLAASESFFGTETVADVRARVSELASGELRPSYVGITLLDERGRLQRLHDSAGPLGPENSGPWANYPLDTRIPTATAVREQRIVAYGDRAALDADHAPAVRALVRQLGLHAIVAAPLPGTEGPVGSVVLGWDAPRVLDATEQLTLNTIVGYAAQALGRAQLLQHRQTVAQQLQEAMLSPLPAVPGLLMAARYQPADSREHVGGDWYDVMPVPDDTGDPAVVVSVGDIVGHDVRAATVMSQVRSMLRQAAWDQRGTPPSRTLAAWEQANTGLGLRAAGTAVLAQLRSAPDGRWSMTWTNAGHPPPILVRPGGRTVLLDAHDALFGFPSAQPGPRSDHHVELEPGATVLLYSDGLVERRDSDLDIGTHELRSTLAALHDRPPGPLVDAVIDTLARESADDVVVLAVHVPAAVPDP